MIFNLPRPSFGPSSWDFDGSALFEPDGSDFELALLSSGTLTLRVGIPNADVYLINAGAHGGDGGRTGDISGGPGGSGGRHVLLPNVSVPAGTYTVSIGTDGDVETALGSLFSVPASAAFQAGGAGGSSGYDGNVLPGAGSAGLEPWPDGPSFCLPGVLFGPGGGGGGSHDQRGVNVHDTGGAGGAGGTLDSVSVSGGAGGSLSSLNGKAATAPGGGGGGGMGYTTSGPAYHSGTGGAGASGAILIRKHKEATA